MSEQKTEDAGSIDGWSSWRAAAAEVVEVPRLRLLYHADPARIGASCAIPRTGERLVVGRNAPSFGGAPIADPQVSREQARLRWRPEARALEVEPVPGARRALRHVALGGTARTIDGAMLVQPGECLAIGDRVLLGLELARPRGPEADRLGLVGESEALWRLREEIVSIARFGRSVLIMGPTGAGKELVARSLHRTSPRASGPFVPVNCAALPEKLVESMLFGHKKGAFTGAESEEKGLFRAADGGTLFLDEVGELPLEVQPKLLRALQEGVVVPVGSTEERRVDVRVVAATHRDLGAAVSAGGLREDLYHRIAGHVLLVPSLEARAFDVPELFVHLLARLRTEHPSLEWLWSEGQSWRLGLPIGFIVELMRRPWRGNVRELENVAERTARLNLEPGAFRAPEEVASSPEPAYGAPAVLAAPSEPSARAEGSVSGPSSPEDAPLAMVRFASLALGLAQKTVLKLLSAKVLAALDDEVKQEGLAEAEVTARLRARAADALVALLEAEDYNQSDVAGGLGTSRTTLIKLMDDLGLPRATALDAEQIAKARAEAGGDLEAAAKLLRVSPSALKKRLTLLNLKARR